MKILVVDDEKDILEAAKQILEMDGHRVYLAPSGGKAIEILKTKKFDCIFSDVRMSDGSGLELFRWMKKNLENPPAFVFLTGFADITEKEVLAMGATAYISKPFSIAQIVDVMHNINP